MLCQACQDSIRKLWAARPNEPRIVDEPPELRILRIFELEPSPLWPMGFSCRETPHHTEVSDLQSASRNGCPVCSNFWDNRASKSENSLPTTRHSKSCRFTYMELNYTGPRIGLTFGCFEGHVHSGKEPCYTLNETGREVPVSRKRPVTATWFILPNNVYHATRVLQGANTGAGGALELAKSWLQDCKSHHTRCGHPRKPTFFPTRLLDLQACEISSESHVKLVLTSSEHIVGPYNTLSHCWGREPFLCLLDSNLDELRRGIEIRLLTESFQEAIEVNRRLGVRYL
jgi:hypothetical protein